MPKSIFKFLSKNYEKIILLTILAIASFYRLYRIQDYMTFLGDEGRDVLVVYGILHGNLTLLGPTASVGGFFLGPIYYYFMAPFLWLFNYNPVGPAVMVALFGIATVWLVYKVGKEFFGSSVGLIASALYAISPLVVTYSKSSWNPNLMPFFSLLALYLTYKAMQKKSTKLLLLLGFIFGILMQLHYLAVFLGVVIAAYIMLYQFVYLKKDFFKNVAKKYLFVFLGFLVGWSPFLVFELRHGFLNLINIFDFIVYSGETGGSVHIFNILNDVFFRIYGNLIANLPRLKDASLSGLTIDLWSKFTLLLALASSGLLIYKCFKAYKLRKPEFAKYSLITLWLVIGVGLFGFYKKSIYDYYFGFMFPLPFLIIAIFLKNIYVGKIGKIISAVILLALIYFSSLTPPYKLPANGQLNQIRDIANFVVDKTNNKPFNFALIADGNSDHAYRYFFALWQKDPTVIQNDIVDPQRKTVEDQLLVVCESAPNCKPLGHSLWEIAGFGRAEVAEEWSYSVVKIYKLVHYKGE